MSHAHPQYKRDYIVPKYGGPISIYKHGMFVPMYLQSIPNYKESLNHLKIYINPLSCWPVHCRIRLQLHNAQQDVLWHWGPLQRTAFGDLKFSVCTAPLLIYPDP